MGLRDLHFFSAQEPAMGLFDFLRRRREPEITDSAQLRAELERAVSANDVRRLEALCRGHKDAILAHFAGWKKVPEAVRIDPQATQSYVNGLIVTARYFDEVLGDPSLIGSLMGPPGSNPLVQWQNRLAQARSLMDELHYQEAAALLTDLLIDMRKGQGTGVDQYLPLALGHLGECHLQRGDAAGALPHFEHALARCEQTGDAEGVAAYLGNLYEAQRYLGQGGPAAGYAERLAGIYESQGLGRKAARMRRQAQIVRAGEPLNRLVAVVDGQEYELDEVPPVDSTIQFNFTRNRITLRPAQTLHEQGQRLGSEGKFEEALETFRAAAQADPLDPYPHYEAGVTLLYLGRFAEAIESYEAAEERAPGWFLCRSDLWLARQLALGVLEPMAFLALRQLEDGALSPRQKLQQADEALRTGPDLPHLHYHRGRALAELDRSADAEAAFRAGLARDPEPDIATRLLVGLAGVVADEDERRR